MSVNGRGSASIGAAVSRLLAGLLAGLCACAVAVAQPAPLPPVRGGQGVEAGEPQAAAPAARPQPPGYERDLLRLSEVMGALAFLRTMCGAADGPQWRERMATLMESEARDADTRARIAGAFNQGYRAFAVTYRTCTPAAQAAVSRYLAEGERLTRAIAGRFGE